MPSTIFAHAILVESEPKAASVVSTPPDQIKIWFNENVASEFKSLAVVNNAGKRVDNNDIRQAALDRSHTSIPLFEAAARYLHGSLSCDVCGYAYHYRQIHLHRCFPRNSGNFIRLIIESIMRIFQFPETAPATVDNNPDANGMQSHQSVQHHYNTNVGCIVANDFTQFISAPMSSLKKKSIIRKDKRSLFKSHCKIYRIPGMSTSQRIWSMKI